MNFATIRNPNCQIRRWAGIGLYADDSTSSGPRFIETCWNSPEEWLNDGFISVYLAYLASISQRKVVVVDSLVSTPATAVVRRSAFKNYTFGYDPNTAAEVILMPLNFPNHWTLLVHDVAVGTFFADSLHISRMDSARSELIKDIIVDIVSVERSSIVIEDVNNLTPQQDGYSCGYFACLYAEAWLMSPKTFILKNLNINYEKKRILWHLNELYSSDNVPYHPRADVALPCPFVKRLEMEDVQSTSKFVQSKVQEDSDDSDDIMIVDVPANEKKEEESIFFIDPPLHEQAVHPASAAMNAVLAEAELPGENQADELALIVESCQAQEPIAQADASVGKNNAPIPSDGKDTTTFTKDASVGKKNVLIPPEGKDTISVENENSDVSFLSAPEAANATVMESGVRLKGSMLNYRNSKNSAMHEQDHIVESVIGMLDKTYGDLTIETQNPENQNSAGDTLSSAMNESRKFLEIPHQQQKNVSNYRRRPPPPRRKWKADVGTNVPSKSFSQRRGGANGKKRGQSFSSNVFQTETKSSDAFKAQSQLQGGWREEQGGKWTRGRLPSNWRGRNGPLRGRGGQRNDSTRGDFNDNGCPGRGGQRNDSTRGNCNDNGCPGRGGQRNDSTRGDFNDNGCPGTSKYVFHFY
ncbi:hypothetical protein GPALN_006915 [Globodera pallida]|nr:hypothetical protein GPALN_006915 [Globodera pallida]